MKTYNIVENYTFSMLDMLMALKVIKVEVVQGFQSEDDEFMFLEIKYEE